MTEVFVPYFRVSTDQQGRSGLGLEAQKRAVADYVRGIGGQTLEPFVEVESGKRKDRPELARALALARRTHRGIGRPGVGRVGFETQDMRAPG